MIRFQLNFINDLFLIQNALLGYIVGLVVGIVMSVGVIVYQVPSQNLPLSAEMCLNETYIYLSNETMVTGDVTLWTFNVTQMPTGMDADSHRFVGVITDLMDGYQPML